jgi:CBS domain-containing protein/sporulation protein YlmC with PRC-barrel domain
MAFISELTGKPVSDLSGQRIGTLDDLIASVQNVPHPVIVALVVKRSGGLLIVPYSDVAVLIAPAIPLTKRLDTIVPYKPAQQDLYLSRDVLDKQIIDTDGIRVVRVNDLEITRANGNFYVANVDIGSVGLLRRLGLAHMTQRIASKLGRELSPGIISWDDVELISGDQPMRLRVSGDRISDLHPADLAEVLSDLNRTEGGKLLESLDAETAAETLEEVEPDFQASLVEGMSNEKVADVLEEMAPDEAADLLAEIPQERSATLLNLMHKEEAADVRKLLTFPIDSAGGIMNTEYVTVSPDLTAEQAIAAIREQATDAETIFYVYVIGGENKLAGVFSLRDLILAQPRELVKDFMHRRVVSVKLTDSQDLVAQIISKYDLVAVPVVDDQQRLQGIVTSDDALDKIIPTAWKKRLPRLYHH